MKNSVARKKFVVILSLLLQEYDVSGIFKVLLGLSLKIERVYKFSWEASYVAVTARTVRALYVLKVSGCTSNKQKKTSLCMTFFPFTPILLPSVWYWGLQLIKKKKERKKKKKVKGYKRRNSRNLTRILLKMALSAEGGCLALLFSDWWPPSALCFSI